MSPLGATAAYALVGVIFIASAALFYVVGSHAIDCLVRWNDRRRERAMKYRSRR